MAFLNAQDLQKTYPGTFHAPKSKELEELQTGDLVKLCNGRERFWVKICSKQSNGNMTGEVDNALLYDDFGYKLGDIVEFHKDHIFDILDENALLLEFYKKHGKQAFKMLPPNLAEKLKIRIGRQFIILPQVEA